MNKRIKGLFAAMTVLSLTACTKPEASIETRDDNTVKVTAVRSGESGGTGIITIEEGQVIRADYALSKGSFDIAVVGDTFEPLELDDPDASEEELKEAVDASAQEVIDNFMEGGTYRENNVSGEGYLTFNVEPGEYTLYIMLHDATGDILISAE